MKKIAVVVTLLFVGFLFTQATFNEAKIVEEKGGIEFFHGSFEEALDLAKLEGKMVFMDAYATWCGPCKGMSRDVFTNREVGELFNAKFISVKMDMEKGEGPALARKYGVRAYPTLFFLDADGKVKGKEMGYHNNDQLIGIAKKALR